ncbi:hypothetical protein CC99x_009880 [Candidatus Berkiella cookevillensis]|uniref:Tetratricopeptide repeat protein n=1 Tax=Candidatus Berkiella cookevillensis TaxID=437022 RepID=A0A0Q9YPZ0_9GAMM|nr:hypothetical protein [Candidatus Berkiella cookevillensis]MCS5709213.1 hypothetical protein [Candidatus Berkiella cookevillensis]
MRSFVRMVLPFTIGLLLGLVFFPTVHAAPADQQVEQLRKEWAVIKYQTPQNQQLAKYELLIKKAETATKNFPGNPSVLTWHGTILSSYSATKGGLGALPYVKKARTLLEQAIKTNSRVENGFALAVLGTIYARVPGWPVAFGSKKTARSYLEAALKISPRGIDSNYYYGDFLVDVGEYQAAKQHLEIASQAPIRKGYELQDQGRKREIAESLAKLKKYLR